MARTKEINIPENDVGEDVNVFPEGHIMNEWDFQRDSHQKEILNDRSRETQYLLSESDSDYYIPREWWPEGYQLGFMVEYVLGVPQPENLRKRQRQGWVFVNKEEMPQYETILMDHEFDRGRTDNWIRTGGHILMKKPIHMYEASQEKYTESANQLRQESEALTSYMRSGRDPRFIVENNMKYQPSHTLRRN